MAAVAGCRNLQRCGTRPGIPVPRGPPGGYAVGSAVLAAVLTANDGPTAAAPVAIDDERLQLRDGIEAKEVILTQLAQALEVLRRHDPARIVTLGEASAR